MKPVQINVVSIGPGSPELLTLQTVRILRDADQIILRTKHHPVAGWLKDQGIAYESLDEFYSRYDNFDEMHHAMAKHLWERAKECSCVFGVADPWTDGAVRALEANRPVVANLQISPGLSLFNSMLAAIPHSIDTKDGMRLFSASGFLSSEQDPSIPVLITELDSALLAGEVKIRLTALYDDLQQILFFPPSETGNRHFVQIPLWQLDQQKKYDHTSAVFIPASDFMDRKRFCWQDLVSIVQQLRAPDGCPWDRIQTHESLQPYMVEEAWEAVNAINEHDSDHLADELGDVLFQVFIHASIGETFDEFDLSDVLTHICQKMIHRHPHVFSFHGDATSQEIAAGWEKTKRAETGSKTAGESLDDVSTALPALKYAIKVYKKLAQIPALRRNPEDISEDVKFLAQKLMRHGHLDAAVMSQLLLCCTELCYADNQDGETLLHLGTDRLKAQYQRAEQKILQEHKVPESMTYEQLCDYMDSVQNRKDLMNNEAG